MPAPADLLARIEAVARQTEMGIDEPVYIEAGRDPRVPILTGSGDLSAPVGVFGRDPGRFEVVHGEPFVGKGGQLVRDGMHRARHGGNCPGFDASLAVGRGFFWANTVPYKPTGNKAWSVKVKRAFLPLITELLVDHWQGADLLTLGNVAFDWFRLADRSLGPRLKEFWTRPDRYEATLEVELAGKTLRLHPLPHPSPLNATWYPRFPALLDARLQKLGVS